MAFIETPVFPDRIARNVRRTRITRTEIVEFGNGFEQRNKDATQKRRRWDLGFAVRTESDYAEINHWSEALDGPFTGFRMRDPADYQTTASAGAALPQGVLCPLAGVSGSWEPVGTPGVGYGAKYYQLQAKYARGNAAHYRSIRKPRSNPTITRGVSSVTYGVAAGNVAADLTNGVVTFVADSSVAIASHTPGASHVFTTATDLSLIVGERIFISGVTGTGADTLNDMSHEITVKSGSGPYTWTIGTTTAGLTTASGTVYKYPQASEALVWSGEFDNAVRFLDDEIADEIMQRNGDNLLLRMPQIVVIELLVRDDGQA
jgi:uncharacterized protein (TIGR02217 family)